LKQAETSSEQITFDLPRLYQADGGIGEPGVAWERVFSRCRLLWSRRRFLGKVAAVGLAMAALVAFLLPASYESRAQLMPPDSSSQNILSLLVGFGAPGGGFGGQSGGLGGLASDLLGMKSTGALFIGVLESRTVEDSIIDQLDLKHIYRTGLELKAEKKLTENTEISEDRKSGIITLTVTDHDPKRAAEIAGSYVSELNKLMASLNTSSAHRERIFLEDRLHNVSEELEEAEQDFSQYSSKNTTIDVTAQAKAMLESSAMLEGQLVAAQSELEGLRQIFTENNVRVRSTEARIAELRQQIQQMAGPSGPTPTNALPEANNPYPSVRQLPLLGVGYADHLRRVKVDEAVFEALTKEYELAKVEEAKEIPTVKVLDPPNVPERKSFPPRLLIASLGTVFSLILGAAWVIGSASWLDVDPKDPRKAFAREVFEALETRYPWISGNGENGTLSSPTNGNGTNGDRSRRMK
jgi:capsule polysaccharide export protein KpsE/RkpR